MRTPRTFLAITLLLVLLTASPAEADQVTCRDAGTACIAGSGYEGEPIWGYPVDRQGNNCTTYAAFRLTRNGASDLGGFGDATHWAERAAARGFTVDDRPEVGSIAHWTREGWFAPRYGHVAYVERVTPRRIYLSDSNIGGGSKRWSVTRRDPEWPHNFIHIKDLSSGSVSIAPERTRLRIRKIDRTRSRVEARLSCPAIGTDCVAVLGVALYFQLRRSGNFRLGLGSRVIEIAAGQHRDLTLRLPRRLDRRMRAADRVTLRLRVDSLGFGSPSFVRRRLE